MKTTNQFDYPTAAATTFKAYQQTPTTHNPKLQQQAHYQQVIRQTSQLERSRVQQELQRKRDIQNQEEQTKIREEIRRKKQELLELENKMEEAIEHQRRASEMAVLKEGQDTIRKVEESLKARENQQNAQFRFRDALRRLQAQRDQNALQERQAQNRRKINQEAEKMERNQAIRFKDWLKNKEQDDLKRNKEEEQKQIQLMRTGLGRIGLNRGVDYSKTCFHNPHMVFKGKEEGPNAIQRGEDQQARQQELKASKRSKEQQNRKRSLERGDSAMQKLSRNQEYQAYLRQTEQEQVQYNLQRIEEGKKNQYVGVKPLTLTQVEGNKKLRGEQQFEAQFLAPNVAVYQQPASKYLIIEKKNPHDYSQTSRGFASSYQSPYPLNQSTQRPNQQDEEQMQPREGILVEPTRFKPMAQTRAQDAKPQKEQLYYSESQQDSSYV